MTADAEDRFCQRCDVDLGLHPVGDGSEFDCEQAVQRADFIDRFWSIAP